MEQQGRASVLLNKFILENSFKKIGLFYPLGSEINLLQDLDLSTQCYCFPRVNGEELQFYHVRDMANFEASSLKVFEPVSTKEPLLLDEQDLVLVPGVVFNKKGQRIGMGKGFYDRYLAKTFALKIGLCFSFQVLDEQWLSQAWDEDLDGLLTEKYILFFTHTSKSMHRNTQKGKVIWQQGT